MRDRNQMEADIAKRRCIRCDQEPRVCYGGSFGIKDFLFRCGCWHVVDGEMVMVEPMLSVKRSDNEVAWTERYGGIIRMEKAIEEKDVGLVARPGADIAVAAAVPMTVAEFKARQELVDYVVSQMEDGVHFGTIPNTSGGPSLWEPGAEYMRAAFRIDWRYEWLDRDEDYQKGLFRYRCRAFAVYPDGTEYASWEAMCSSAEPNFGNMSVAVRPNIAQDRCLKRAFVNLIRNVTGTSGIFKSEFKGDTTDQAQPIQAEPFDASEMEPSDWLTTCLIHGEPWEEGQRGWWAHTYAAEGGARTRCNRKTVINREVKERIAAVSDQIPEAQRPDDKAMIAWFKAEFGGRTRSVLDEGEQVEALDRFGAFAAKLIEGATMTPDGGPTRFETDAEAAAADDAGPPAETTPPATGPTTPATKRTEEQRMSDEMDEQLTGQSDSKLR